MNREVNHTNGNHEARDQGLQMPSQQKIRVTIKGSANQCSAQARKCTESTIEAIFASRPLSELLTVAYHEEPLSILVEIKPSTREPLASFVRAGELTISISEKILNQEAATRRVERSIMAAAFVELAVVAAEASVRSGEIKNGHKGALHSIACAYAGVEPSSASRAIVRETLAHILEPLPSQAGGKKTGIGRSNYLRDSLEQRMKRVVSKLSDRIDCSTFERAERARGTTMDQAVSAKVLGELLNNQKNCTRAVAGAITRLVAELRQQFAQNLIDCDHACCNEILEIMKKLHADMALGAYDRPLPIFFREHHRAPQIFSAPFSELGLLSGEILDLQNVTVPQAAKIATEIRELMGALALNQELQINLEASSEDLIDHVITLITLAPGLSKTLTAIQNGEANTEPEVFDELVCCALAMRKDPVGDGLWYHDLLLSGRDIPAPIHRNPARDAPARAETFLRVLQILQEWRFPSEEVRSTIIRKYEDFFSLFSVSTVRAAIFAYESQVAAALINGNDALVEGADVVLDDISIIEANLQNIVDFCSVCAARQHVEKLLREAIGNVRAGMTQLVRMSMQDDELVRQASDDRTPSASGPLKGVLIQAQRQLQERIARYAEKLTAEAEDVLSELYLQDSSAGIIEHSRKLLDVMRLSPSSPHTLELSRIIDSTARSFIEVVVEGYGGEVALAVRYLKDPASAAQTSSSEFGAEISVEKVARGLQNLHLMTKELRAIREGLYPYKDLLQPTTTTESDDRLVRGASVCDLAAIHVEQKTKEFARLLKARGDLVQAIRHKLKRDMASADTSLQNDAKESFEGLLALRLPRSLMS